MRKNGLFIVVFCLAFGLKAQNNDPLSLPQTAYFMYNKLIYNPAAAGTGTYQFNAAFLGRYQWLDYGGGIKSNLFTADYKFPVYHMAVGVNVSNYTFGANANTDFMLNYSYYIPINDQINLSFGLRAGVSNTQFDPSKIPNIGSYSDPVLTSSAYNVILPKFGGGLHLYSKAFYVSFSAPDIVTVDNANVLKETSLGFFTRGRNYVGMAGYKYRISDQYAINGNIFTSYNKIAGFRADFNAIFEFTDYFWAGGTYSSTQSITLMAGTNINSRIKFGYAYVFNNKVASATHEINLMLALDSLFRKKAE